MSQSEWLKKRVIYKGKPSTTFGEQRFKCRCGKKVRYVAKSPLDNELLCKDCWLEINKFERR